jgi:amidophosphoribosyltransferase
MKFLVAVVALFVLSAASAEEGLMHECGLALVRLRKPISYFAERYQDPAWGTKKCLRLIERQNNRGQDGAGLVTVQLNRSPGEEVLHRFRASGHNAISTVFEHVMRDLDQCVWSPDHPMDEQAFKRQSPHLGEIALGHLRYATHSKNDLDCCQPFVRAHSIASRHFALAGNFNMANTTTLLQQVKSWGDPLENESDTQIILNMIAHYLDEEYKRRDSPQENADLRSVLSSAAATWDGGYTLCGVFGHGDLFVCRDPAGIRPGYYYLNEEVFAVASEKVALMDTFDLSEKEVLPILPGHIFIIKRNGEVINTAFAPALPKRECLFERIYFSKAHDPQIYAERKALGRLLAPRVLEALNGTLDHTIFTYVPNSSISAFQGLVEEISKLSRQTLLEEILSHATTGKNQENPIRKLATLEPRVEYLITKNQRLRTFISSDHVRNTLAAQLYEVTRGIVTPEDTLVIIDDSIVRGTTLKESLITKLIQLNPKRIIIVSSAPPVFYPDCYGIDMSQIGRFIAFQAAIRLLQKQQQMGLVDDVKHLCAKQAILPPSEMRNAVKKIYDRCTQEELSRAVAELLTPPDSTWKGSITVIYQSLEGLHQAMPDFKGDWCFTGDYPTPGGFNVLNTSYLQWSSGNDARCY